MAVLPTNIVDGTPGHAGIHNATNTQVNTNTTDLAAKVDKATFDANTILKADSDDTPTALSVAASRIVGRKATGGIAALTMDEVVALLGLINDRDLGAGIGESVLLRHALTTAAIGLNSGTGKLTYFRASKTRTIQSVRFIVGAVAASATPTLSRIGVYSATEDGALTGQMGATPNDTALYTGSTSTAKQKSFSSSFQIVRGNYYAVEHLCITAGTVPQLVGVGYQSIGAISSLSGSRTGGQIAGQSDLPTTVAAGGVADTTSVVYSELCE